MRRVLIVVVLVIAAAVLGLWRSHGGVQSLSRAAGSSDDKSQGVTGDETRKTFELQPGARVQVQGINGKVDIQTSDTKTAEVFVRRTGDNPASLRRRELIIEQTAEGLVVRSKQNHLGIWEHLFGHDPNEEVTIKAPRQIALMIKGVNGRINMGDIDGPMEVKGVNGRIELGQTSGSVEISGVNGRITVGLTTLNDRGMRLSGVNGGIELRLTKGLNADLTAKGMNGNVRSEIPEVTVDKDEYGQGYSARIGTGGAPITLSGINGNVRLISADNVAASATINDKKEATPTQKPTQKEVKPEQSKGASSRQ